MFCDVNAAKPQTLVCRDFNAHFKRAGLRHPVARMKTAFMLSPTVRESQSKSDLALFVCLAIFLCKHGVGHYNRNPLVGSRFGVLVWAGLVLGGGVTVWLSRRESLLLLMRDGFEGII